ncbi:TetR/AcrR family transcriptional regulator [Leekyejoonella antrihumi]|nr:TetR/AcrR family transcriptional regulator [Leekyejoonella antrihumi]
MDVTEDGAVTGPRVDGRHTRWTQHRQTRRRELTEAAIVAIRKHGATVGMDEIAAQAGTSKTVIYRHLGDRLGLYLAVCEAVDAQIMSDLRQALSPQIAPSAGASHPAESLLGRNLHEVLMAVIDAYLHLVERDPEVYRFVVRRPLLGVPPESDPVVGLTNAIADTLTQIFSTALTTADKDPAPAATWAHGLIGLVRAAADRWLGNPAREPREVIVRHLADFAAVGLTGVLAPQKAGRPSENDPERKW